MTQKTIFIRKENQFHDFRARISNDRCWDLEVQKQFQDSGVPGIDCILQNREELIAMLNWMKESHISSYLEIGIWTGKLISMLTRLFKFKKVAACDLLQAEDYGLPVSIPPQVNFFTGDCQSNSFLEWRESLGEIDLVFIDAGHSYESVCKDFEINRSFPHRYLAFHDITGGNRNTIGVSRFWQELAFGTKLEIIKPHREIGLDYSTMGIGIWSESD